MQAFRSELTTRFDRLKRAAHVDEVRSQSLAQGEFIVILKWSRGPSGPGEYRKYYTRQYVLGRTASAMPLQQRPKMKACRFVDELAADVLRARGV